MFIIRWYPNCITPIHGHTGLDCNFLVLRGNLQENLFYKKPDNIYFFVSSTIIKENQSSHINDSKGYHSIKNLSDDYSWSLHRYTKLIS